MPTHVSGDDALQSFFDAIVDSSAQQGGDVSPDSLKMMGERAAARFLQEGTPLNNSIVKMASDHHGLTHEHIKRVAECANTTVYLAKHDQAKTAGATSSAPHFPLADPEVIIQRLGEAADPQRSGATDSSYSRPPSAKEKISSAHADEILRMGFGMGVSQEAEFTRDTLVKVAFDTKSNLTDLRGNLQHSSDHFVHNFQEAQEEFYDLTKRHMLGGRDFAEVIVAATTVGAGEEKTASILAPIIERLMVEKVASANQLTESANDLDQFTHRVVNPDHPFVRTFGEMVVCERELEKVAMSLADVDAQLVVVRKHIKESFSAHP